jgi:hypothetical protein
MTAAETKAWWKRLEPAYKALLAIIGFVGVGMAIMGWLIGGTAGANASLLSDSVLPTINVNSERLTNVEHGQLDQAEALLRANRRLDRILCNQDPAESFQSCEVKYGSGG